MASFLDAWSPLIATTTQELSPLLVLAAFTFLLLPLLRRPGSRLTSDAAPFSTMPSPRQDLSLAALLMGHAKEVLAADMHLRFMGKDRSRSMNVKSWSQCVFGSHI